MHSTSEAPPPLTRVPLSSLIPFLLPLRCTTAGANLSPRHPSTSPPYTLSSAPITPPPHLLLLCSPPLFLPSYLAISFRFFSSLSSLPFSFLKCLLLIRQAASAVRTLPCSFLTVRKVSEETAAAGARRKHRLQKGTSQLLITPQFLICSPFAERSNYVSPLVGIRNDAITRNPNYSR